MSTTPKHLGQSSALPASPEAAELDYVPIPQRGWILRDIETATAA